MHSACNGYGVVTYYRGQEAQTVLCTCGKQERIQPPFLWTREYCPWPPVEVAHA